MNLLVLFATPPIAALDLNIGQLILLVAVIGGVVLAITIPLASMFFDHRERSQWHETARLALEKGQPVPPALDGSSRLEQSRAPRKPSGDVRTGLILIAAGAGLWVFLAYSGSRPSPARYLCAIPTFIGFALLLYAFLAAQFGNKPGTPPDSAPRS